MPTHVLAHSGWRASVVWSWCPHPGPLASLLERYDITLCSGLRGWETVGWGIRKGAGHHARVRGITGCNITEHNVWGSWGCDVSVQGRKFFLNDQTYGCGSNWVLSKLSGVGHATFCKIQTEGLWFAQHWANPGKDSIWASTYHSKYRNAFWPNIQIFNCAHLPHTQVDTFVNKFKSIPAFTANLTMEGFQKATQC